MNSCLCLADGIIVWQSESKCYEAHIIFNRCLMIYFCIVSSLYDSTVLISFLQTCDSPNIIDDLFLIIVSPLYDSTVTDIIILQTYICLTVMHHFLLYIDQCSDAIRTTRSTLTMSLSSHLLLGVVRIHNKQTHYILRESHDQ